MCTESSSILYIYIFISPPKRQVFGFAPCMSYVNDVIKVWYEDVFICIDIEPIILFNCNIDCVEYNNDV